jgi:hypothetical protein
MLTGRRLQIGPETSIVLRKCFVLEEGKFQRLTQRVWDRAGHRVEIPINNLMTGSR